MQKEILRTLLYFDIFEYPLKVNELADFLPIKTPQHLIESAINQLCKKEMTFRIEQFLLLDKDSTIIEKRLVANKLANKLMPTAFKRGIFIAKFPFVEATFISGSMSKNVMHESGDIDFFIVTKKDRLWISRAILVLYKRIFLLNSRKEFCINYFKSTANLKIEDENMFTAVELSTIIPVAGASIYQRLIQDNQWINNHVSGFLQERSKNIKSINKGMLSKFIEFIFSGAVGNVLEKQILQFTKRRNKKKYMKLRSKDNFNQMFRSNKESAKVHPNDHQGKVLQLLKEKEKEFLTKHKLQNIYD